MSMIEPEIIKQVIKSAFPDEFEIADSETLDYIARGGTEFKDVRGGHDFDLTATIDFLKAAAQLTTALVVLYRTIRPKDPKPPSADDLLRQLPESDRDKGLTGNEKLKLAQSVVTLDP